MKFLIIGGSGFIGCRLLSYLESLGYEVLGTQSSQPSVQNKLRKFELGEDRIFHQIEPSFFADNVPVFAIICAAISQIDRCYQDQPTTYQINVEKTCQLIDDLKQLNVRPVFLSSDQVFDGNKGYYSELDSPSPINEYGRQKLAVEHYLATKMPDQSLVLRLSKIVGDASQENHLLSDLYHKIMSKQPIYCVKDQWFSPTLVEDIVRGILLSCQQELTGIYHLANPQFFQREEWVRQFAFSLNQEVEIISQDRDKFNFADQRPLKTYLDATKFAKKTEMQFTFMREVFETFTHKLGQ